jgi:UDP-N-acetylglucosamine 2-epimerase
MKICTIIGARPQFIKAETISRAIKNYNTKNSHDGIQEVIIHTGQHYDDDMSAVFFRELEIPDPVFNLGIGSGAHGAQTGRMLIAIEEVLLKEKPDRVLIYGDTNSTLAGALAAVKLHIRIAHVEAGLRSFNRLMPEEINRVVSDHLSHLLLCPSQVAVNNLSAEGIIKGVYIVGDVMADALQFAVKKVQTNTDIKEKFHLQHGTYLLATIHRAENTDNKERLHNIIRALNSLEETIVLPIHPRTRKILNDMNCLMKPHVKIIDPVGYFDMIALENSARMILTDSGGIQKEAYWLKVPCITLRDETEWVETVENGWNKLTGANSIAIIDAVRNFMPPSEQTTLYGDGHAAYSALQAIINDIERK